LGPCRCSMLECKNVGECMAPYGEIPPLAEGGLEEAVVFLKWAEVEGVAVCLLFAFLSSVIYLILSINLIHC